MIFILFIVFFPAAGLQEAPEGRCPGGSCNPQLGDLMVGRASRLSASSTCGLDGPQKYCIIGYLEEEQKCFTCDSRLPYNHHGNPNSHRIENVITTFDPERKTKWWQSENGAHHVSVRLDLETVFQFSHLVLTFKSFRPAAMLVERSKDFGRSWKVLRYFAEDCSRSFPSVSSQPANSIDDIVCDSRYSGSDPSTNGEVVLKALDPIFELEDPYAPNVQELITLTNLRVNFSGLFTLGDLLQGDLLQGDLLQGDRPQGDRPQGDRPQGDGPQGDGPQGDGPQGDGPQGDRPQGDRPQGDQPQGDGPQGDRPQGDGPQGDGPQGDGPQGDRPQGDLPQGDLPQGDRPQGDGPQGDRPQGDRPQGDRPQGDGLPTRRRRTPEDQYYYALYNMVLRGSCFCHGHASSCTPLDAGRGDTFTQTNMVHGRCVCQHNTAGENCERCQDFHHDAPWRPGGGSTASACRRCNCNGHSHSCHFDAARFEASGRLSGGVCEDCLHDRAGPQCERCRPFLFQDPERAPDHPLACRPCDCDPAGSEGGGLCDALSGRCVCKEQVEGRRCDRCKHGFFNLRADEPAGCQVCRCHVLGSVGSCDQQTGSCECVPVASGPLCDQCLPGFWGLGSSESRCSPCDCDVGGAYSSRCSPEDGQCQCLPNMAGPRCSDPAPRYFLPPLDYFLYEAELAAPLQTGGSPPPPPPPSPPPSSPLLDPVVSPQCERFYREHGYDFKFMNGRVVLVRRTRHLARRWRRGQQSRLPLEPGHALQIIPRQRTVGQPITWTGLGLVRVKEGAGLRFTVDNLPSPMDYQLVIRYESEPPSDWLASVSIATVSPGSGGCSSDPTGSTSLVLPANSRWGVLDSGLCLTAGARYLVDVVFSKLSGSDGSHILIDSLGLVRAPGAAQDFCSQRSVDSSQLFGCVGLNVELNADESLREVCEGLMKSLSARVHNGAVLCRCNADGSLGPSCSKLGGFCECKPNVIGRCCDTCSPLTFGFGPDGCEPCECDPQGALSEPCDQVGGQCVCRSEVTGRRCDRCQTAFWGFPSCRPCQCHELSEECDQETGECLNCRQHATGPMCERCVEGYLGDPGSGQPCQPCLCPEVTNSGRFFATSCQHDPQSLSLTCTCREGHAGPRCDRCSPGFYGDLRLPGARCMACPCNDNINPADPTSCDSQTGACQRCLHHTTGARCQDCRPGYYGDALDQDCKECSCDRRGTEVTQCPLGSPCFCDSRTGQCPCRTGVMGALCDECEDGYWNLDGASGCQACSCDSVNSFSNMCSKVTGQCPCRPEFGGRQCDECGENHFGNPDLQCISCDCNVEGTERPSCDPETGECLCRVGVAGIFCDECAPGYDSVFPACGECHPCNVLWGGDVADVQRAALRMRSFIPRHRDDDDVRTGDRHLQQMLKMHSALDDLAAQTGRSQPDLQELEELCAEIRKLHNAIDPNAIVIDPSALLNMEMDNVDLEFRKLLNSVKEKLLQSPDKEEEHPDVLLDDIQKLHETFVLDEQRVRNATNAVEGSMDRRQEVKHKLNMCSSRGDLMLLEKKVQELSVANLNRAICGGPGLEDCSGCGGALCGLDLGKRKCGGPNCDGVIPVSQKASETAEGAKEQLLTLPSRLLEAQNKINNVKQQAEDTKDQAKDLQDQIHNNMDSLKREKNKSKELIQQVKDYLVDEMVPPEDIEKMAQAVLAIRLPRSPDQMQSLINDINNLLSNPNNGPADLEEHTNTAHTLLQEAQQLQERMKNIDVTEIRRDIYGAENAQDKANDDLDAGSRDKDAAGSRVQDMNNKLADIDTKLMNRRSEDLQNQSEYLRRKTEQNRETAEESREAADSALNQTTDTEPELREAMKQFELLKQKRSGQLAGDEAGDRLRKTREEAQKVKEQVEDKLQQLQDLDQRIQQLIQNKEDKAAEVAILLEDVDSLRREISRRADGYVSCTA